MKKIITFVLLFSFVVATFWYTTTDVSQANYLASKRIIKDWSSDPKNYRFDDYIARSEIMGMVLAMMNITRNTTCRGDFADVPKSNTDWVCRTIETAADKGFINAQKDKIQSQRKARPYNHITRAEALGILMKAYPNDGGWAGYSYYWSSSLPTDDSTTGYKDIYPFGSEWQARVFYDYIRKILEDDSKLYINPRASERATRGEVFEFAYKIDKKSIKTWDWSEEESTFLGMSFKYPKNSTISSPIQRETSDGININELIITPAGEDATRVHFFLSYESNDMKNIKIVDNTSIKKTEYLDIIINGYSGVRRVDYFKNNSCTSETTTINKNGMTYGFAIQLCPSHAPGYDQIRKDIVNSMNFL